MERSGRTDLASAATRFDRTTGVRLLTEDDDLRAGTFRFAVELDESWASPVGRVAGSTRRSA